MSGDIWDQSRNVTDYGLTASTDRVSYGIKVAASVLESQPRDGTAEHILE